MRQMIRKWLLGIDHPEPIPTVEVRDILTGTEMAFVAYRIDNGYLLRMGGGLTLQNTIIYCADETAMVEKIVAYRSKIKLTGPQVMSGSDYAAKSNKY